MTPKTHSNWYGGRRRRNRARIRDNVARTGKAVIAETPATSPLLDANTKAKLATVAESRMGKELPTCGGL